jgi:hypothetical protein
VGGRFIRRRQTSWQMFPAPCCRVGAMQARRLQSPVCINIPIPRRAGGSMGYQTRRCWPGRAPREFCCPWRRSSEIKSTFAGRLNGRERIAENTPGNFQTAAGRMAAFRWLHGCPPLSEIAGGRLLLHSDCERLAREFIAAAPLSADATPEQNGAGERALRSRWNAMCQIGIAGEDCAACFTTKRSHAELFLNRTQWRGSDIAPCRPKSTDCASRCAQPRRLSPLKAAAL